MTEKIRVLSEAEFEEIFSLLSRSFPEEEYRDREGQRALFRKSPYRVIGYEEEGALLGILAVWELESVRFAEHLAVAPEARNRGIGKKLLTWYLQMPLRAGDEPLPLYIMSYPDPVSREEFLPWKREIYARVYGVFEESAL